MASASISLAKPIVEPAETDQSGQEHANSLHEILLLGVRGGSDGCPQAYDKKDGSGYGDTYSKATNALLLVP